MQNDSSNWTGIYNIKAIYKYKQEVEANSTFELVQKLKELNGKCIFKKQSIWKEDMTGLLDDESAKKVKLNIKWYNSAGNFQNQSDLMITMDNEYKTFEGIIKNMMYTGYYYGTKILPKEEISVKVSNSNTQDSPNNIRKPGVRGKRGSQTYENGIKLNGLEFNQLNNNSNNNQSKSPMHQTVVKSPMGGTQIIYTEEKKGGGLTKEDLQMCIICCEKPKQSVFVPCGHKCCCEDCAAKFIDKHKCPFCKKSVESIIAKVFE